MLTIKKRYPLQKLYLYGSGALIFGFAGMMTYLVGSGTNLGTFASTTPFAEISPVSQNNSRESQPAASNNDTGAPAAEATPADAVQWQAPVSVAAQQPAPAATQPSQPAQVQPTAPVTQPSTPVTETPVTTPAPVEATPVEPVPTPGETEESSSLLNLDLGIAELSLL